MELTTVALGILLFLVLYIAYRVMKLALRTLIIGLIGGATYGALVYFDFVNYSQEILLTTIIVVSGGYLLYKLLKLPIWVAKKVKNIVLPKKS